METLLRDLRHAIRGMHKSAGFTTVAVLTLALGIGATTAIFSVVNGVLLRPLPFPEPKELMQIRHVDEDGGSQLGMSFPNYADLRDQNESFEAMAAYASWPATVSGDSEAMRVGRAEVSAGFFEVLGVEPLLGRRFLPDEPGAAAGVAVVSHGYWQRRLGGEHDLSQDVVRLGEQTYQVVGVMPAGFSFPAGVDLWLPTEANRANQSRTAHNFHMLGRLKDGVTLQQARANLRVIAQRLKERYGDDTWMSGATALELRRELTGSVRPALLVLLGAAGFLLLIACANVVNLLLARMAARRRDLAVRVALGAGRGRVALQFLAEALVLCLIGGALGVLLAFWGVPLLLALQEGDLPRVDEVGVSWAVLGFALGVSVAAALGIGLAPALRAGREDLRASLADGQRSQGGGISGQRIRRVLAVSQVALTLVLLVGAGLLGQSFLRLLALDPGYRTDGPAVVMDLWLPYGVGEAAETRAGLFHRELLQRIRAIPGVEQAGGVNAFPLSGGGADGAFLVLDSLADIGGLRGIEQPGPELFERLGALMQDPGRAGYAEFRIASDGYFRAMGIPLVRGRLFDGRDASDAPHVAVISRSLAETRWPNEDPLGKLIEFGNMDGDLRPFTIVGIVGDVRERSLAAEPEPTLYGYSRQRPVNTFSYHVIMRGTSSPASMIASARAIVRERNPEAAAEFRTLEQVFSSSLSDRRFTLVLMAAFGAAALLLAMLGIYGVISYLASQRVREIGVRMALGARAGDVLRLFVGQGAALALAGVACGLLAALLLTRLLGGLLYDVGVLDPVTFAAVALVLTGVALLASFIPARRASRLNPTDTLRSE